MPSILHLIDDLLPESGGPPAVAIELAVHLSRGGNRVAVVANQGPRDGTQRAQLEQRFREAAVEYADLSREGAANRRAMDARVASLKPDLIHLHGMWGPSVRHGASVARRRAIPYLLSTHGMLHPYALAQRAWKKRVYLALFPGILPHAAEVFALNGEECAHVAARFTTRVSVLPNGISAADYEDADPSLFRAAHPSIGRAPFLLALGRLHPIKGLDQLVRSYAVARGHGLRHRLVVVGPEDGGGDAARRAAVEGGVADDVVFAGPAYGAMKRSALAACAAVVHRPRYEGFGLALVEALASGKPVVTTERSRLDGAVAAGAILCAPDTDEGFADALVEIGRDQELAQRLGTVGRAWALAQFDWTRVAARVGEVCVRVSATRSGPSGGESR